MIAKVSQLQNKRFSNYVDYYSLIYTNNTAKNNYLKLDKVNQNYVEFHLITSKTTQQQFTETLLKCRNLKIKRTENHCKRQIYTITLL